MNRVGEEFNLYIMFTNIKSYLLLFFVSTLPIFTYAQQELADTFKTNKSNADLINLFEKKIVIDKEDYNITIEYKNSKSLIFSGRTTNVFSNLQSISSDVLRCRINFKIEMTYLDNGKFILTPQKIKAEFFAGAEDDFDYMSSSLLEKLREELTFVKIYGPDFEVDKYFLSRYYDLKNELDLKRSISQDVTKKKKERKRALKEYEDLSTRIDVYDTVLKTSKHLLTKLYLYYFLNR